MPNLAELNVVVGADVKQLDAGLQEAKQSLTSFATSANTGLSKTAQSALNASNDIKTLTNTIALLGREQAQVSAQNIEGFRAYELAIQEAKIKLNELKSVQLQEIPVAKAVAASNIEIAESSTKLSGGLSSLKSGFSLVRQAAYLLPGIGIAGIFSLAFEGISAAAQALDLFNDRAKVAAEETKKYSDELASIDQNSRKAADSELSHARVLITVAQDNAAALSIRKDAVNELQKLYPSYLGNLSAEKILTGDITAQVNALTQAIISKSLAEAAEKKFAESSSRIYDLMLKRKDAVTALTIAQNDYNAAIDYYSKHSKFGIPGSDAPAKGVSELHKRLLDAKDALNEINTLRYQADADQAQFLNDAAKFAEQAGDLFIKPTNKQTEALQKQTKAVKELHAAYQGLNLFNLRGGATAPNARDATGGTNTPVNALTGLGDQANKAFEAAEAKGKAAISRIGTELQQQMTSIFENLAVGIGESIGDLFTGKANILQTLGKVLGAGIKALGAQLIKLGITAQVIQNAIKNLLATPAGPFVLIAGGIALEAIGTAISNLGIQQHAEGGIFDKPTLIGSHLFGEKGPEVLLPLNRLSAMLGGMGNRGSQPDVIMHRIQGNELLIWLERSQRSHNRNYGTSNG